MVAQPDVRVALAVHRLPPCVGGSEGYAGRLAQGLAARGHDVVVYTSARAGGAALPYRVRGLHRLAVPGCSYVVWPQLLRPGCVREVADRDVLHAVNFASFSALAWLWIGRLHRIPLVLTTFYHPPRATGTGALSALYDGTAGRLIANGYGALLVHSAAESRAFRRHVASRPGARLREVTCPPVLADVASRESFRRAHQLEGRFVALFVGRDDRREGAWSLLWAAAQLRADGTMPELAVVLVGPFPRAPWPPAQTALLAGTVNVVGPLLPAQLAAAYAESDVVVVPSAYESYGLVIVEALSYGTPVISTRAGGAASFVRPGENGYLFDYGDVAALMRLLIEVRSAGGRMRAASRRAVAHLSWDRTVNETVAVYREVVESGKTRNGRRR